MKKIISLFGMSILININSNANDLNSNYSSLSYDKLIEYFSSSNHAILNSKQDLFDVQCPTSEICTAVIFHSEINSINFYSFFGYTNNENNISYITINLVNKNNEIISSNVEEYKFNNRRKRGILTNTIERNARGGGGGRTPGGGNWEGAKEAAKWVGASMVGAWVGRQFDEFNQNLGNMIDKGLESTGFKDRQMSMRDFSRNQGGGGNITDRRGGGGTGGGGGHSNMAR